ncbi:MAG: protein kinase [Akkermansiaceae bacterium]|nr:protein kinase [Akkermansiaceae bacterium]
MTTCPNCDTNFDPAKSPGGLCPFCLMMGGAEEAISAPDTQPGLTWRPSPAELARNDGRGFQILEQIGRGGMGSVYRAWQPSLGRPVAVKVLPPGEGMEAARERFENEARVLGHLEHPNIMPVHDLGQDEEGRSFYAMKLVKGRTLQRILDDLSRGEAESVRRYPLAALLTVFEKVCDAVSFAHSQRVLHRDLKPDNIMVGEFGEVLVLDWGLAKILDWEGNGAGSGDRSGASGDMSPAPGESYAMPATLDGDVMGTPQYMSPEQAEGVVADLDERSDVFSLGGVLYAILALRSPVDGDDISTVLKRVRTGAIPPPSTRRQTLVRRETSGENASTVGAEREGGGDSPLPHCPGGRVPAALSAVAMKALRVDRAARYQSVSALQAEVMAYQRGFATSAEEAGLWRQFQLLTLRHKAAAAALLALVLFSVAFVLRLMQSEHRARESAREANAARLVAQDKGEAERRALAESRQSLAEAAYRAHDSPSMLAALDGVPEDLRGMDWNYLRMRADNSTGRFSGAGHDNYMGAAPHPTRPGVFAAVDSGTGDIVFLDVSAERRAGGFAATARQRAVRYDSWAMDFSPDGSRLVTGRPAPAGVCVYEVASGRPLGEWPPAHVIGARFHPDGSRVLVVTDDGLLSLHDAATGEKRWEKPMVSRALFLPSGEIAAAYGGQLRILDDEAGKEIRRILSLKSRIFSMANSRDGTLLYLGGDDGWVRACGVADGSMRFELPLTESARLVHVALSGDGRRLLAAADLDSGGRVARMLDASSGRTIQNLMGGDGRISAVGFHPLTGDVVISGLETRAWSAASLPYVERVLYASHFSSAFWGAEDVFLNVNRVLTLTPDGAVPAPLPVPKPPVGADPGLWCADAAGDIAAISKGVPGDRRAPSALLIIRRRGMEFKIESTAASRERVEGLRLNADGSRLAAANGGQLIEVFDTSTGRLVGECDVQGHKIDRELTWIGPHHLAGIAFDHRRDFFVWDANSGQVIGHAEGTSPVLALAASPDGERLAEGGEDRRVRIRDAGTLEVTGEFIAHDAAVTALAFHPSLPLLATGSRDRSVRLWNLADGKLVRELEPSREAIVRLSFSPDGTVLACADHAHFTHFVRLEGGL